MLLLAVSFALGAQAPQPEPVDFVRDIRPILSDRCFTCHGPDAQAREADLRLDIEEGARADLGGYAAIVAGDPDESELIARVSADDDDADRMPPVEHGPALTDDEVELLRRWISEGGKYETHWAFVPPTDALVPEDPHGWSKDTLDHFVRERLDQLERVPGADVDDATFLRRASYVLTGLPPTAERIERFPSEWSRAQLVDDLLADDGFGEHMAATWLDAARYADTYGYQSDVERRVWPYRDWVIRSYNDNLPYDEFVRWQVAGDQLPRPSRDQLIATAFQRLHRMTNEGGSVEEEFRIESVADRVETTGTAFLGLTVGCARCHDHKYDPISQKEFYALSDFFDDIDESGLYSHFTRATPTPAMDLPNDGQVTALEKAERDVALAERGLALALAQVDGLAATEDDRAAIRRFALDTWTARKSPGVGTEKLEARAEGAFEQVESAGMRGVRLNGDDGLRFGGVGKWSRADPFAVGLRLSLDEEIDRAVLLHRSKAWHDAASCGWQLLIEDGRLTFALVHFWPGDMIAIRTRDVLPLGRSFELECRYDGSSRAAGLEVWIDGKPAAIEMYRDHLTRTIMAGGPGDPRLGARFRDRGFTQGVVDEVWFRPGWATPSASAEVKRWREQVTAARKDRDRQLDRIPQLMVMRDRDPERDARLLERGMYDQPAEPVGRGVPAVLLSGGGQPQSRLELAEWMLEPEHPLTARVAVDRLWRVVFGRGLVSTPENWGSQGTPPSHPELLDRLARDFVDSGWDRKALLRRLVLSRTFGMRDAFTDLSMKTPDAEPRRLTAEMARDSALEHSGLLVEKLGGPSVRPYQPEGVWVEVSGRRYQPSKGEGLYRRSLYTYWKRTAPPPSMMLFDAAKRDVCVVKRELTRTPLQVLARWNDPQVLEAARVLAAELVSGRGEGDSVDTLLNRLGRRLGLGPDHPVGRLRGLYDSELGAFREDAAAAEALLGVGAKKVEGVADQAELAAWTVVTATIFASNLYLELR